MIVDRDLQILRLVSSFDLQCLIIQRNLVFKYHATFSSTAVYFEGLFLQHYGSDERAQCEVCLRF